MEKGNLVSFKELLQSLVKLACNIVLIVCCTLFNLWLLGTLLRYQPKLSLQLLVLAAGIYVLELLVLSKAVKFATIFFAALTNSDKKN
jgi:hypothetical protein